MARVCEGCGEPHGARFRTLANQYLDEHCYAFWQTHGATPAELAALEDRVRQLEERLDPNPSWQNDRPVRHSARLDDSL